jgi:hypothetical protein
MDVKLVEKASSRLNFLRNAMPYRVWELLGRRVAQRAYTLHLCPQFSLEVAHSTWLYQLSEEGKLVTLWESVSKGTIPMLLSREFWGLFSRSEFSYHLLRNHVLSESSLYCFRQFFPSRAYGVLASCAPFGKAITGAQWMDLFDIAFDRLYVDFILRFMCIAEGLTSEWLKERLGELETRYKWPEAHSAKLKKYIVHYEGKFRSLIANPGSYPKDIDASTPPGPKSSQAGTMPVPFGIFKEVLEKRPAQPLLAHVTRDVFDDDIPNVNMSRLVTAKAKEKRIRDAEECIAADCCTFTMTSTNFIAAVLYSCTTCNMAPGEAICVSCKSICHIGHETTEAKMSANFYCDCGASGQGGKFGCRIANRALPAIAGGPEVKDPLWINGYQDFPFRSILFARETGLSSAPKLWSRLTKAAVEADEESFSSAVDEHYAVELSEGNDSAWQVFAFVDDLKIDLMTYALVRIRDAVPILKRLYMEWRSCEALVAILVDAKAASTRIEIAKQKLVKVRGVYVLTMQRFAENIGTHLLERWGLEGYTEVCHRIKSWDNDKLTRTNPYAVLPRNFIH